MTNFKDYPAPTERHPTAAARASLSRKLGLNDHDEIQDWERYFADPEKIEKFLVYYVLGKLNEDEKFLLMDLILASANDAILPDGVWEQIETWLQNDSHIHHYSIWYWADIDEETGLPDNSFQISRRMQALLAQELVRTEEAQSKTATSRDTGFGAYWKTHFPGQDPVCFKLRETLRERWIRFHALPDSKRYAETADEWSTLLERNNTLGNHVLGEGSKCWLVLCRPIDDLHNGEEDHLERFDFVRAFDMSFEEFPGSSFKTPVNVAETVWFSGQFNDLIRAISMDREGPVMLVSQDTHAIYGPYDGGVDLILPNKEAVPRFRCKYHEWLPQNSQGL